MKDDIGLCVIRLFVRFIAALNNFINSLKRNCVSTVTVFVVVVAMCVPLCACVHVLIESVLYLLYGC